jgi:hypothetical protein
MVLARHQQLAREFIRLAHQDGRATGDWLRRLAREPTVSSWLFIDQLAILYAARPGLTSRPGQSATPPVGLVSDNSQHRSGQS